MLILWKKSEKRHILNRLNKIIIIFLISFAGILSSQTRIEVDDIFDSQGDVTPLMFGNFFEFISNFINGSYGLWAQEINNRGFDLSDAEPKDGASDFWYRFNPLQTSDNKLELLTGGYNPNGKYFQRITKFTNDDFGIYQNVYVYDTVGGDFYIYLKTKTPGTKAKIMLCDTAGNSLFFTGTIDVTDTVWRKYSLKTPPIKKSHHVNLVIGIEGTGTIDIDEASFMAENNVDGIKHEYHKIFEEWKPGIIRYPGGWFADCRDNKLENCIGDMDKRFSPFSMGPKYLQRMDFGLEEFMRFCKRMDAEPHIVINLETGTPQEAVNYLLYCNGDTNTAMGKLRKANGVAEPYKVKYWEVGNEQWFDLIKMATNYVPIYDAMKKTDPGIKLMKNGN